MFLFIQAIIQPQFFKACNAVFPVHPNYTREGNGAFKCWEFAPPSCLQGVPQKNICFLEEKGRINIKSSASLGDQDKLHPNFTIPPCKQKPQLLKGFSVISMTTQQVITAIISCHATHQMRGVFKHWFMTIPLIL